MTRPDLGIFNIIKLQRGLSAVHLVHTDYRRMVSLHNRVWWFLFCDPVTRGLDRLGRVWHGVQCCNGWSIGPGKHNRPHSVLVFLAPGSPPQLISLSVDKVSQLSSGDSPQLNTEHSGEFHTVGPKIANLEDDECFLLATQRELKCREAIGITRSRGPS